jgi:hypothetical protein
MNKEKNNIYHILEGKKKHFLLSICKFGFISYSKLNDNYDGLALKVGFLMILYGYL